MKKAFLMGFVFCFVLAIPAAGKVSNLPTDLNGIAANKADAVETGFAEEETPARVPYARLVFYREKKFTGSALRYTIWMDGVEVADLKNGSFFMIKAAPGEHKLHADEEKDEFTIVVEEGKTYYYRGDLKEGLWKGHGRLSPVDASFGEKEFNEWLPKLKYTWNKNTLDPRTNP